ncbi:MAG: hypothetical protein STSR0002_12340 [Smithella sp.]
MIKVIRAKLFRQLCLLFSLFLFCCLIGCGGSTDTADTGGGSTTTNAASLDLLASPPTVKSDGSTSSTITVTAKNSSNAALSGVTITMSADTGNLSTATVTTGSEGTATLTFSSGGGVNGPINRTATITATSGSVSSQVPIEVVGSTVTLNANGTTLTNAGTDSITLTVTAKNAGSFTVNGAAVTLTQTGTGSVNIASPTGVTNSSGVFTTTVTGATAGTVTILARALGASAATDLTVATATETFAIDEQRLNGTLIPDNPDPTAMVVDDNLAIRVNVPSTTTSHVIFATSIGTWVGSGGAPSLEITPAGGKATATLNTASAGTASVQVYLKDTPSIQDTLTVYMRSGNPAYSIILQATPTVVPMNTGTSTITATVRDSGGSVVANAPVSFSMVNPTGGGETIMPVVMQTAANGTASTTFTAGTLPSYDAGGVKIHAEVIGTAAPAVKTGLAPSGNDAAVVIGGVAGSIAFGQATVLGTDGGGTQYTQAMSVLVTDINGNPVSGATISLSAWPIAWSTGVLVACAYDPDNGTNQGTFLNEDVNENLILDAYTVHPPPNEDGLRLYYDGGTAASDPGTVDTYITPTNSSGGSVPSTVTTGINGVATFVLTYPKQSAIWTITRIRASTIVQGSETVGQTIFRLSAVESDVNPCRLGNSPYAF